MGLHVLKKAKTSLLILGLIALAPVAFQVPRASAMSPTVIVSCDSNNLRFDAWTTCKAIVDTAQDSSSTVQFDSSRSDGVWAIPGPAVNSGTSTTCTLSSGECVVGYFLHASGCFIVCEDSNITITATTSISSAQTHVKFHSCWFQECLVNSGPTPTSGGIGAFVTIYDDWVCIIGNEHTDSFSDCKLAVADYSDPNIYPNGVDFKNIGISIPGSGAWAALASGIIPFSGCPAITAAVIDANSKGESVPDVGALTAGCSASLTNVPCACAAPLSPNYIANLEFYGGVHVPDDSVMQNLAPLVTLGGPPLQAVVAELAVSVAIACGFGNYYCFGANVTANIMQSNALQSLPIPLGGKTLAGNWGDHNGAIGIGWSKPTCNDVAGFTSCSTLNSLCISQPSLCLSSPVAGSAGPNNGLAPIQCATGKIGGLSIGYDGDVSFDLNDSSIRPLVNPHNSMPGSGGTAPPNGVDVEIALSMRPQFGATIQQLRVGSVVHICGRWVTDTHDLWNELHPITSLIFLPDFKVAASPSDVTVLAGGQTTFNTIVNLISGPSGPTPITLSVQRIPTGATASFSSNPVPLVNPTTMTGTSTLTINTSNTGAIGDFPLTINGTDQSGFVIRTANVTLHLYDFAVKAPSELLVLQTGKNSWPITLTLTSGSSTVALPTISLSDAGLPSGVSTFFTPTSGSLSFTSTYNVTTVNTSAGNYSLTLTGTDSRSPEGGTRTASPKLVVLTPQQALKLLVNQVNALRSSGKLTPAQASSLTSQLSAAINSLNTGKTKTACNQLSSFINLVNGYVLGGTLSKAQADQLLNPPLGVYAIMAAIPC